MVHAGWRTLNALFNAALHSVRTPSQTPHHSLKSHEPAILAIRSSQTFRNPVSKSPVDPILIVGNRKASTASRSSVSPHTQRFLARKFFSCPHGTAPHQANRWREAADD